MQSPPLYTITHVGLDTHPPMPPLAQGQGHYVVFWWKEIALGHVFFDPPQPPTEALYYDALLGAIAPAVQQYAARRPAGGAPWQAWLAQRDLARWSAWLGEVLADCPAPAKPPLVPISAIICTRNRAPHLRRCLQQLRTLACAPAEIVVVDNAPTDTSTYAVCQEFAGIVYLQEPQAGLDFARNTGIRAASHPVVAFIDDDVVVHVGLPYHVWKTFQDPVVAAATGLVIASSLHSKAQVLFEHFWSFNRGYVAKRYDPAYLHTAAGHAPPVWEIGAGANMAFRKSIFDEVGYFDELLGAGAAGCGDDSEMWHRILLHGHAIQYNPQAVVYHEHRREMPALKQQLFSYMRGFAAAALTQQAQQPRAGYVRHLCVTLPKYYARLLRIEFPLYRWRTLTLWSEITGLLSGVIFYYRHRRRPFSSRLNR